MPLDWPFVISLLGTIGALLIALAAVLMRRQRNEEVYQGLIFTGAFFIFIGFLLQALPYIANGQGLVIAQGITAVLFAAGVIFAISRYGRRRPKKNPPKSAKKSNQKRHPILILYEQYKNASEAIGLIFSMFGVLLLVLSVILIHVNSVQEVASRLVFPTALATISLGLGSIAIGLTTRADKRFSEILGRMLHREQSLPYKAGDKVTPPILSGDYSREAAQKRLDDDTRDNQGQQRGELYEVQKGKWAIHWGGEHPLDKK